jgi:c-di-GMP-binding flagellar brake protein YcgR
MNNTFTDEELERCTLTERREIVSQLRSLIKQGETISVTFDGGRHSFLSVLIDISLDEKNLYFDIGGSDETNSAFLRADHCIFTSVVDGIRIQFPALQAREATLRGELVLAVALPKSLLRLQRRDVFRIELPTTTPYICRIRRGSTQEKALPLHDISIGGVGILSTEKLEFERLEILNNSWIDLRDSGALALTLEVRYITAIEGRTGKPLWHMGCQFIKLSALNETLIQRFMGRIETERRALLAG